MSRWPETKFNENTNFRCTRGDRATISMTAATVVDESISILTSAPVLSTLTVISILFCHKQCSDWYFCAMTTFSNKFEQNKKLTKMLLTHIKLQLIIINWWENSKESERIIHYIRKSTISNNVNSLNRPKIHHTHAHTHAHSQTRVHCLNSHLSR